jgi:hypothetical protein
VDDAVQPSGQRGVVFLYDVMGPFQSPVASKSRARNRSSSGA